MRTKLWLLFSMIAISIFCYAQSWLTTGNSGLTTSNFLGTTDGKPLLFKTNNVEAGRLLAAGTWRFGSSSDNVSIDITGKLSFNGSGAFRIGDNRYIFQNATNTSKGLFYNSTLNQYEFRNGSNAAIFL